MNFQLTGAAGVLPSHQTDQKTSSASTETQPALNLSTASTNRHVLYIGQDPFAPTPSITDTPTAEQIRQANLAELKSILDAWVVDAIKEDPDNDSNINTARQLISDALNKSRQTKLVLEKLKLKSLPDCFHLLTKIRILDLDDNQLKELPESIAELTNVFEMHLRRNQFDYKILHQFSPLVQLLVKKYQSNKDYSAVLFSLHENKIESVHSVLTTCSMYHAYISLEGNPLSDMTKGELAKPFNSNIQFLYDK
jgi:hypothetical protein